jgi:hypothetical protein
MTHSFRTLPHFPPIHWQTWLPISPPNIVAVREGENKDSATVATHANGTKDAITTFDLTFMNAPNQLKPEMMFAGSLQIRCCASESKSRRSLCSPTAFEMLCEVLLVPLAGIEPALLAELDFESSASTNSATGAFGRFAFGRGVTKRAEYSGRACPVNPR